MGMGMTLAADRYQSSVMKVDTAAAKMVTASVTIPKDDPPPPWNPPASEIFISNVPLTPSTNSVDQITVAFHNSSFKTLAAMEEMIEGGPWLFQGQPIILQKSEPGMVLRKLCHTQVQVWIKMRHLPVELWTTEGLSIVASEIGKPLYQDATTRACMRLDFARVCVMLDISSKLPKHVIIMISKEDASETACKVDIEYEWLPLKCNTCVSLGRAISNNILLVQELFTDYNQ
ncbi:UNVERIFIED_CONTAM: hypothetical protein Slati_1012000 [Sesamum latifolium]|uniref:DUF4283 domain-containing protein n=1 Tax=Sesamum latifolium TaxID=2727402 RepID=A0AAW2XSX6_9LAMI